jgi:hypothetical protein
MNTNATKSTHFNDADASQRKSSSSKSSGEELKAPSKKSMHQHHDGAPEAKTKGRTKVGANYVARAFPKNDNGSKKKEPKYVRE